MPRRPAALPRYLYGGRSVTCCDSEQFIFARAHTVGERLLLGYTTDPTEDLTLEPVTVFLDSQDGLTRHVLKYLNDGTDGDLSVDTFTVTFEKTAEWSAANMTGGEWRVRFARGTADVDLHVVVDCVLNVIEPPYGAIDV
jgi:hypothetical protein